MKRERSKGTSEMKRERSKGMRQGYKAKLRGRGRGGWKDRERRWGRGKGK